MYAVGILTVSDSAASGRRQDEAGPVIRQLLEAEGYTTVVQRVVADDRPTISQVLSQWIDRVGVDLVLTTGGTGLSPRDVTPEATREVIEREIPGIGEAMRSRGMEGATTAMLSRGIAGVRGEALIVNLPGSPDAARQGIEVLLPALKHALDKIKGDKTPCNVT